MGIGAGKIGVGDNGGEGPGILFGDIHCREQALDEGDLLVIRKMHHNNYLQYYQVIVSLTQRSPYVYRFMGTR